MSCSSQFIAAVIENFKFPTFINEETILSNNSYHHQYQDVKETHTPDVSTEHKSLH